MGESASRPGIDGYWMLDWDGAKDGCGEGEYESTTEGEGEGG